MTKDRRNPLGWAIDHPWSILLAAVLVWFTWWVIGTRQTEHKVQASFASAFNLVPGLAISVDGIEVGKIAGVKYDGGRALVKLGINDEKFWPLHEGTRVVSRWGTTIGNGTRRLDLVPGPVTNKELPENGIIPVQDTQPAVDVDEVLNALDAKTRKNLSSWMKGMGDSFKGNEADLQRFLAAAPDGTEAASGLLADLGTDTFALRNLIRSGERTTDVLANRDGAVRSLVTVAARTFETFAANTRGTQDSISELPGTLRQAKTTLRRVDGSIDNLDDLVDVLGPGARALRPLAASARPAFADLRETVPSAVATLRTGTSAAPDIKRFLKSTEPFMTKADDVFADLAPMIACIRPYAPEAGGTLVSGATAFQNYDIRSSRFGTKDRAQDPDAPIKYPGPEVKTADGKTGIRSYGLRAQPQLSSSSVNQPTSSKVPVDAGLKTYAFPRPPGFAANQPVFIPECGITKDALDASKDPEAPENMTKDKG